MTAMLSDNRLGHAIVALLPDNSRRAFNVLDLVVGMILDEREDEEPPEMDAMTVRPHVADVVPLRLADPLESQSPA